MSKYKDREVEDLMMAAGELIANMIDADSYGPDKDSDYETPWTDEDGDPWYGDMACLANALDVLRGDEPRCICEEE